MTGRGIDQILPHPGDPTLYEGWVKNALDYVRLAERSSGPIPQPVDPEYIWGEALAILDEREVDARIINLETAITAAGNPWPAKGIHYRMHPANIECITRARIDVCSLANNHVLDWSYPGLTDTIATLDQAGIAHTGAGVDLESAWSPATLDLGARRVVVLGVGMASSGVIPDWAAEPGTPGVAVADLGVDVIVEKVLRSVERVRTGKDLLIVSIHWGPNWGYDIPAHHRELAHALVDSGADVIHGHSSHHPMALEVYENRPIFYGCGDLINDYEGIGGRDEFHPDVRALYLADFGEAGYLAELEVVPLRSERLRLVRASGDELDALGHVLNDPGNGQAMARFEKTSEGTLQLLR